MPYLSLEKLITDDGDVDPAVYRVMIRRRALNEYGSLAPRALRQAVSHYRAVIPVLLQHWNTLQTTKGY